MGHHPGSKMVFLLDFQLFLVAISLFLFSMVSSTNASNSTAAAQDTGILVIGGSPYPFRSVELWSPAESCVLEDYPREMYDPTANLVSGELVACYEDSCDIYDNGEWNHLVDTREPRAYHSTAVKDDRLLLIGGLYSNTTTEWIPMDGSPSQPGPFEIRHGHSHCTLQISNEIIIVTGGYNTEVGYQAQSYVTEYHLTGVGNETPLSP